MKDLLEQILAEQKRTNELLERMLPEPPVNIRIDGLLSSFANGLSENQPGLKQAVDEVLAKVKDKRD